VTPWGANPCTNRTGVPDEAAVGLAAPELGGAGEGTEDAGPEVAGFDDA
jgi:hypothetical protein